MSGGVGVRVRRLPMSGPMVRALPRKTHTRRVMWPQPDYAPLANLVASFGCVGTSNKTGRSVWEAKDRNGASINAFRQGKHSIKADVTCPYGAVGDRAHVLETWAVGKCADGFKPLELHPGTWLKDNGGLWYAADDAEPSHPISPRGKWRPGRFMPGTWASRFTLRITGLRVERVQDISEDDAKAEGVEPDTGDLARWGPYKSAFAALWQSLNGPRGYGFDKNPWVWVIEFARVDA